MICRVYCQLIIPSISKRWRQFSINKKAKMLSCGCQLVLVSQLCYKVLPFASLTTAKASWVQSRGSYSIVSAVSPLVSLKLPKLSVWVKVVLWQVFFHLSAYTTFEYLIQCRPTRWTLQFTEIQWEWPCMNKQLITDCYSSSTRPVWMRAYLLQDWDNRWMNSLEVVE